jgi:hypothetical protein
MVVLILVENFIVDEIKLGGTDKFGIHFEIFHHLQKTLKRPVLIILFFYSQICLVLEINLNKNNSTL